MLLPLFLALAVFAVSIDKVTTDHQSPQSSCVYGDIEWSITCRPNRIVGGNPTTIDEFPSTVQIDFQDVWSGSWSQHCGGSILNSKHILSAAHCFEGSLYQPKYRRIRASATYRNYGGVLAHVEIAYNHPTYGKNGRDGDISLIRLSDRLVYSPAVQPTTISTTFLYDNMIVFQVGWGAMWHGGPSSEVLRVTRIFTMKNELCRERYATIPITENMICTAGLDGGTGQGDSGGPLYYRTFSDPITEFTTGVVSWSETSVNVTVNTVVAPYVDWILKMASSS